MVYTIIATFFIFILRHNGYYAYIFFAFFLLIGLRKYWKQILIMIAISVALDKIYIIKVEIYFNFYDLLFEIILINGKSI